MKNILAIARLTYKEGLRQRLLYGVIIMALLFMTFAVLVSGFFIRDIAKILIDFCLSTVSVGGLIVPIFLAVNMLAGDVERRTVFPLLSQPISRRAYLLGKFGGLALLTGQVMLLLGGAGLIAVWAGRALYGARFFTSFRLVSYLAAILMNYLGIMLLNGLVVLWCCVTTSSLLATLLTLASYVIGQTIDDIVSFIASGSANIPISPTLKHIVYTSQYIFPDLAAFDLKPLAAYGLPVPWQDIGLLTLYGLGYGTVVLGLAVFAFNRRDLT